MELTMVEANSPVRCQHVGGEAQCYYKRLEGNYQYCPAHAPVYHPELRREVALRRYKLASIHARVEDFIKDSNFKSLREEVALLRHSLEQLMNNLQTPWDFVVYGGRVESMIDKIGRTLSLAHKLDVSTGEMFDKANMMAFTDEILQAISSEVSDAESLKRISLRINNAIEQSCERAKAAPAARLEQSSH